jgi:membrane protease YdiL (CAAX protease family)
MKIKIKTLGVILLTTVGVGILVLIFTGIGSYAQKHLNELVGNAIMLLMPISVFLYVLIFNIKYNRLSGNIIGFYPHKFIKNIVLGITLAFVILLIAFLVASILFGVQFEFIAIKPDLVKSLLGLIMTNIIIGVWEESYFRGLVLNTLLKNNFGFHISLLISSLLFSILHWGSFNMTETSYFSYIGIVFFGYIFAILYIYFNSIWIVISLHFFWDVIARFISDPKDNKIGLMGIKDYTLNSKNVDNAEVLVLGVFLVLLLYFTLKKEPKNIQSYIANVIRVER